VHGFVVLSQITHTPNQVIDLSVLESHSWYGRILTLVESVQKQGKQVSRLGANYSNARIEFKIYK